MPYSLRHMPETPGTAVLALPTGQTGRLGTLDGVETVGAPHNSNS